MFRLRVFVALGLVGTIAAAPRGQGQGLTAQREVSGVYDAIIDARFTDLPSLLASACPPAPRETCQLLSVVGLWWEIQLDPHDMSRDALFRAQADQAIASAESWVAREPGRAEAWFYLGGSYGARAQWRALRGERLAAARDGKRIKESLERAIALDGSLQDASFGIGLYRYYAAVAPALARMFRWMLQLPGGDRREGLAGMLRARAGGQLLASEADYQLAQIYLWYEKQPARALELLGALRSRHPHNPLFVQLTAEIEDFTMGDQAASLRSWQHLLDDARAGRVAKPAMAEARARLAIARLLDARGDTAAALPHVRAVVDAAPPAPYGVRAQAQLRLGQLLDKTGARGDALAAYRAALAALPPGDRLEIGDEARAGLRTPYR